MRIPFIGANWKMHKTIREAVLFAEASKLFAECYPSVEVALFPSYTALSEVGKVLNGTGIKMGAQNMHPEPLGAFTGEISPGMLVEVGCSYVILGHSERRQIFKESNEYINRKIKTAVEFGLTPLLCIGETLAQKNSGSAEAVCKEQFCSCLTGIEDGNISKIIIAYEPVWAIGTGKNATPKDAGAMISFIRELIGREFGSEAQDNVRILYGGSVKPTNATEYFSGLDIDGALVGGASLDMDLLRGIVASAARRKNNAV